MRTEKRIDHDGLERDDDLACLDGQPFTSIVFSLHPDGRTASEGRYSAGLPEGLQEEWYPGGQIFQRRMSWLLFDVPSSFAPEDLSNGL